MDGSTARAQVRTCLICGSGDFVPMFTSRGGKAPRRSSVTYRITQSSRHLIDTIERCARCGLGTMPPYVRSAVNYEQGADELFAQQAAIRIRNGERLLRLLPPPAAGATLLDIGSAYGFLLEAARRRGYRPTGLEPSRHAADHARRTYGAEVVHGDVESAQLAAGSFDVVTMVDVIEHLGNPAAAMIQIHRWLRPGGQLLILTPDLDSAMARLLGRYWWGFLDDHIFYFSRRTLRLLLEANGFSVRRVRSFGRSFPAHHWVYKLSQYHDFLYRAVDRVIRGIGLGDAEIPLNLLDQMACIATREANLASAEVIS